MKHLLAAAFVLLFSLAGPCAAGDGLVPPPVPAVVLGNAVSGTGPGIQDSGKALPSGVIVGTSDSQSLTNKSIAAEEINSGTLNAARLPTIESRQALMIPATNFSQAQNTTCYYGWGVWVSSCYTGSGGMVEVAPMAGTFRNLYCKIGAAPGSGNNVACTLMVDNSPTSVTCTISDPATSCTDISDTATIAVGHYSNLKVVTSATLTSSVGLYNSIEFDNP